MVEGNGQTVVGPKPEYGQVVPFAVWVIIKREGGTYRMNRRGRGVVLIG